MATSILDPFQVVRDYLSSTNPTCDRAESLASTLESKPHQRLLQALASEARSPIDIVPLVRHVLRHEAETSGREDASLQVPTGPKWPTVKDWKEHSLTPLSGPDDTLFVSAAPWQPEWLEKEGATPAAAAFAGEQRRAESSVHGDPFLPHGGYHTYASEGQKNAIRSVLSAPPGSTLVVNLPTGSGKSQCARLPVLMSQEREEVTVVVVPTVSLAIDQEQALEGQLDPPLAYYSGDGKAHERRNRTIRTRIATGKQSIVFTSPESFCGALAPSLFKAARRGHLRRIFVDEAHIVDQWGDDFRAAFQEIAGVRRGLLRSADRPFKTVLMTATLTEPVLDTLESLFGMPGPFEHVSAVQLRPEPSYWFRRCRSESERVERVFEALRHLPRPLILYTTKREDVRGWVSRLRKAGYQRWDWMTGESSSSERDSVLKKWRTNKIDLVVATSAFGLGVDKDDIRAVVHACLPESVDRYYQEVGRGGRDGKASVSLVAFTNEDVETAAKINSKRLIGVEYGHERWRTMWEKADHISGPRYKVDITTPRQVDMKTGDYNEMWNLRTLNLMHRAGLIQLDAESPPTLDEILDDRTPSSDLTENEQKKVEDAYAEHRRTRTVEITTKRNHLSRQVWDELIAPLRKKIKQENETGFAVMKEMVNRPSETCVANRFRQMYRIPARQSREKVMVAPACGGCPACREDERSDRVAPYRYAPDVQIPQWRHPPEKIPDVLQNLLDGHSLLTILYDRSARGRKWERRLRRFIRWFERLGPYYVVASDERLSSLRKNWQGTHMPVFLETPGDDEDRLMLPEVVLAHDMSNHPRTIVLPPSDRIRILITPDDTINPIRRRGLLRDTLNSPTYRFESLKTRFAQ